MSNKPYISVVMPTYNRANIISASINAVLSQTYPYFEFIIVDDGSQDKTESVIDSFRDERIRYIKLNENSGQSHARNVGITEAKYDYIAFCDSDDEFDKEKLEKQISILSDPGNDDLGFVYHKLIYKGTDTIIPDESVPLEKKSGFIMGEILKNNLIGAPTLMIKKSCIEKTGLFDEKMRSIEDYDFAIKLSKHFKGAFIDEILLYCSVSEGGVTKNILSFFTNTCLLINRYKEDYIATGTLEKTMEGLLLDSQKLGLLDKVAPLLEKCLTSPPM